jgi:peptidoglycan L-alanyl-D-glutamate endopeptidase CwlK
MSKFKLSKKSLSHLDGVDLRWHYIIKKAITLTKVDFGIPSTGGFRSVETQRELFNQGVSKCDGLQKKSRHQSGLAVDVFAYVDGKASWDEGHLTSIAVAILQSAAILGYKVTWGGLWTSFVDMPHFEII